MQKTSSIILVITILLLPIILLLAGTLFNYQQNRVQKTINSSVIYDERVENLLEQMTLAEKIGQMTQLTLEVFASSQNSDTAFQLNETKLKYALVDYKIGSILNVGGTVRSKENWYGIISKIQDVATKQTRLGIPILYGIDSVHGVNYTLDATLFPQQLGLAATWHPELVEKVASIVAYETRASSIPWNFSPVLDIGRQPTWPRLYETLGEDIFLAKTLGVAITQGYQGSTFPNKNKVAACAKHYVGYSLPLTGKDRTPAWIPENHLLEYFLPPFADNIKNGLRTVMVNSSEINGIPVHADYHLLTEILREQLGFTGVIVTDWADIKYLHERHKVAANQKEAVKLAVLAGIDISMVPYDFSFSDYLLELVKEGAVPIQRIDDSVRRILKLKFDLGLFEQPTTNPQDYPQFGSVGFKQVNLQAAQESITLSKNTNHTLPLPKEAKILVTGFTANSMKYLNGGWSYSWQGQETDQYTKEKSTILTAIQNKIGVDQVKYVESISFDSVIDVEGAVEIAKTVDYVILCLGEPPYAEFKGNLNDLHLPDAQVTLALALAKIGKPIILVLTQGRPRLIKEFENEMSAILMAYLPGNVGGEALANIIWGDVNPSGKLPITYPRFANSLVTYDHKYTEEPPFSDYNPQYEFGYGLSYTTFAYSDLTVNKKKFTKNQPVTISVTVTNSGTRTGQEVVQLYISDLYASITPSVKRLRGFRKINLAPQESERVTFTIKPQDLAFVGRDNRWKVEAGEFVIAIGSLQQRFTITD